MSYSNIGMRLLVMTDPGSQYFVNNYILYAKYIYYILLCIQMYKMINIDINSINVMCLFILYYGCGKFFQFYFFLQESFQELRRLYPPNALFPGPRSLFLLMFARMGDSQ
jgi:hypothetical protein